MEDFVRLNLNGMIGLLFYIFVVLTVFVVLKKTVIKEYQKFINWFLWVSIGLAVVSVVFMLMSQLSTNQLQKSEIDRSYQNQTNRSYKDAVKKGSRQ